MTPEDLRDRWQAQKEHKFQEWLGNVEADLLKGYDPDDPNAGIQVSAPEDDLHLWEMLADHFRDNGWEVAKEGYDYFVLKPARNLDA
jgi:hypothetical protein